MPQPRHIGVAFGLHIQVPGFDAACLDRRQRRVRELASLTRSGSGCGSLWVDRVGLRVSQCLLRQPVLRGGMRPSLEWGQDRSMNWAGALYWDKGWCQTWVVLRAGRLGGFVAAT